MKIHELFLKITISQGKVKNFKTKLNSGKVGISQKVTKSNQERVNVFLKK